MNLILYPVIFLYLAGLFFNFAAIVGIIRLPDVYCRLHSSSKNTTLGSLLIILGLALRDIQGGAIPDAAKLLLIGIILMVVSPIATNALAHSAYTQRVPLWDQSVCDQYGDSS
jgi:multicomponent Na+:H+ antiporter subunit G